MAASETPVDLPVHCRELLQRLASESKKAVALDSFAASRGIKIPEVTSAQLAEIADRYCVERLEELQRASSEHSITGDWAKFQDAYADVSAAVAPVTADSLYASTDELGGRKAPRILFVVGEACEARIWSRKLWLITIIVLTAILFREVVAELLVQVAPQDTEEPESLAGFRIASWEVVNTILGVIHPFLYGALGACTFLLRSAHALLRDRTFDPNHIPEYYSRILIGLVGGGTINLFIQQIPGEDGVEQLAAPALGFIAGYSSDFLFAAIERVAAAILPKVGLDTVAKATRNGEPEALKPLLNQLEVADTAEERGRVLETIRALLNRR